MSDLNPNAAPFFPGLLTQSRNLLHHHHHSLGSRSQPPPITSASSASQSEIAGLQISFLNICHLLNKKDEVEEFIHKHNIDIMCLAETFLTSETPDSLVNIPNYKLIRQDRPGFGGGVAAYVRSSLHVTRLEDFARCDLELLFLLVHGLNGKLILGTAYRPPGSLVSYWDKLTDAVDSVHAPRASTPIALVGDFNIDTSSSTAAQLTHL